MKNHCVVLLLVGLLAAACTSPTVPPPVALPTEGAGSETPSVPPATPLPVEDIPASWTPGAAPADLPGGWRVRDCEGDAPMLCVDRNGEHVGILQLASFPLTSALAGADDEQAFAAALRDFASTRHVEVADDRRRGCGDAYDVTPEPVVEVDVGGLPGLRYGFRGGEDGALEEYVLSYATVAEGHLWIVVADGASDTGCMADAELALFAPSVLEEFVPLLDRVVAGTPLPSQPV